MESLEPGVVLGGYRIEAEVARGGMGTIYRARHVEMGTVVAVKVLKKEFTSRQEIVKRFLREGKLVARLNHPGIIKVFDVGREVDSYYIVMEYIDGKNLQQVVDENGPLEFRKALRIGRQVADALHHAHQNGVVHRDIKPSNILLSARGTVHITDFGIARLLDQETALTQAGALIGTPSHMSPEQCRGTTVDERSDVYSLGATLYTLLGARPPFSSKSTARLIIQLLHDNPPPLESLVPDLPERVTRLVKRMMAKHPGARHQTAKEAREAIEAVLDDRNDPEPPDTHVGGRVEPEPSPLAAGVIIGGCALAVALILLFVWSETDQTEVSSQAWGHDPAQPASTASPPRAGAGPEKARESPPAAGDDETSLEARRATLVERISGFQRTLVAGDMNGVCSFVDPSIRNQPNILFSLGGIARTVQGLGPDPALDYTLTMDEEKADVFFIFRHRVSDRVLQFPGTWRFKHGTWYLQPQADLR
jgi:serine/threonine protein kinase